MASLQLPHVQPTPADISESTDWTQHHHHQQTPQQTPPPLQQLQQFQQLHQLQPQQPSPQPTLQRQMVIQQPYQTPVGAQHLPQQLPIVQQHLQAGAAAAQMQQPFSNQHQQLVSQQPSQQQPQQTPQLQQQRILGTAYTPEQREALEEIYSVWDTFTKQQEREETFALSKKIGLTTIQIRGWIQNRKKRGQYKGKQVLAPEQVRILEWVFVNHSNYPSVKLKQKLACELGLKYSRIRTWFQSRRQRGVPAVLTRISQENDSEWNETVQKLRNVIEAVKVEDAFFLRFPFKGSEGDAVGAPESPSHHSQRGLKSQRAGPLQINDVMSASHSVSRSSVSKVTSSPPLMKDSHDLPQTSFSPPASLPSRPSSLNFPPEAAFPLNLLNCDLKGDSQKRKLNYLWKGSLENPMGDASKRRRMTQIPSKATSSFIPPCHQQLATSSTAPQVRSEPMGSSLPPSSSFPKALPSWRENLARLNLEGGPSSARSPAPCNDAQSLPRLHLPQFSPEGSPPSLSPTPFASSDPGVATTSSWTDSNEGGSSSSSTDELRPKSLSPQDNTSSELSQRTRPMLPATVCEASSLPLLPSIRELERAAERSSFSISQIQ